MDSGTPSWRSHPHAPAAGTALGRLSDIAPGSVREFQFGAGRRIFSMLVVRRDGGARAFVNACPHVWLPLTFRSPRLLSEDGERLVCSNHLAEFAVEDGRAISGPVPPGCALEPIPIHVDAQGRLVVGGPDDAEIAP